VLLKQFDLQVTFIAILLVRKRETKLKFRFSATGEELLLVAVFIEFLKMR